MPNGKDDVYELTVVSGECVKELEYSLETPTYEVASSAVGSIPQEYQPDWVKRDTSRAKKGIQDYLDFLLEKGTTFLLDDHEVAAILVHHIFPHFTKPD